MCGHPTLFLRWGQGPWAPTYSMPMGSAELYGLQLNSFFFGLFFSNLGSTSLSRSLAMNGLTLEKLKFSQHSHSLASVAGSHIAVSCSCNVSLNDAIKKLKIKSADLTRENKECENIFSVVNFFQQG